MFSFPAHDHVVLNIFHWYSKDREEAKIEKGYKKNIPEKPYRRIKPTHPH